MRAGGLIVLSALCATSCSDGGTLGANGAVTGAARPTGRLSSAGPTTAGASSGTASGLTTTGSSGSGPSSSTGGLPLSCAATTLADCGDGGVELLSKIVDAITDNVISGSIEIEDLNDPARTATSQPNGAVLVCAPAGARIAPEVSVAGYADTIFSTLDLDRSECIKQLPLFSTSILSSVLDEIPGYQPSLGLVYVSLSSQDVTVSNCDLGGWTFWLVDPDGGAVSSAQAILAGTGVAAGASLTTGEGLAMLYNVTLQGSNVVRVMGAQLDAGGSGTDGCRQVAGADEDDGTIRVAGNGVVSLFSYVLWDAG
jgi:hypothetical protein